IPENCVTACELDQHPGLAITQFRRCSAVLRHVIEHTFRFVEKRERRGARHIVFLGLFNRLAYDLGGALERGVEECLIGLELLPGINRADARCERKHQEHACKRAPETVTALAHALSASEHFVGANANETGDYLGKTKALAIAAVAQIGTKHSDRV